MKLSIAILLFFISSKTLSQNLLVNGGFEEENICTEYQINCAPEAWISNTSGFNNYFKDANRSYHGSHCMAIEAGHSTKPFQRTFIRSQLLCGLRKGSKYRVEFYIKSFYPILDSIGIYFTAIDPLFGQIPVHKFSPALFLCNGPNKFTRDSSWQKVTLDYTANGQEAFIGIANFSKRDVNGPTGIFMENHFFVFLDDISMMPLDPGENLCDDWQKIKEDIYTQNERHEFLLRSIKYHSIHPEPVKLTPNTITITDTLVLPDVLFASGKAVLQPESFRILDSFLVSSRSKRIDSVVIEGHTDSTGSVQLNEQLSRDRSKAVADYLNAKRPMIHPYPIITRGWGALQPLADNRTPAGRQQNRRVEIFVYTRE